VCKQLDDDFDADVTFFAYPAPQFATAAIKEDDARGVQKMEEMLAQVESKMVSKEDTDTSKNGMLKRAIEKVLGITVGA